MTRLLADDVELALQRVLVAAIGAAGDEHLPDHRLDVLGALRQPGIVGRHIAPAEQLLAFAGDSALDLLFARHARGRLLRQKDHADAVLAKRRQREALAAAGAAQERIGKLDQDAGAVALQGIGAGRAAMGEILEDLQALGDDGVAGVALDVRDEPQPAGIVLVRRIVHSLPRRRQVPALLLSIHFALTGYGPTAPLRRALPPAVLDRRPSFSY